MSLPLVALAAALVPDVVRIIAGDRAGTSAGHVAEAVRSVTGSDDPVEAQRQLDANPAAVTQLKIRLAEIALEQEKAQRDAADAARKAEFEDLKSRIADTQGARSTMVELARSGSVTVWGAPLISAVVTVGFFGVLITLVLGKTEPGPSEFVKSVLNITVGALVAAFTAVVNFWIGSSEGSRSKDATVQTLQAAQTEQTNRAIQSVQEIAQTAARAPAAAAQPLAPPAAQPVRPAAAERPAGRGNFAACLVQVLQQEGGFVNNPADPGGATNLGITRKTLEAFREKTVTEDDVRNLTKEEAQEIYRANYWNPMRCDDLPPGIDLMVFDFGTNAGPQRSVKLLQRVAGVTDDGSVGPITVAAVRAADPAELIARFAQGRMEHYRSLPTFEVFGRGWTSRTDAVKQAALRMALAAAPAS
ncbi:glycosyl hydrolase 108 family protein [Roseomonas sp. CAU 1739]|uniref:glycoside hydrolase family 108 protein n=1 Tax=Roseomonas sp. CAU 1739 TaxID=3140364 RepID=UPI00325BA094